MRSEAKPGPMHHALCVVVVLSHHPALPGFPLHFKLWKVGSTSRHFTVSFCHSETTSKTRFATKNQMTQKLLSR